MSNQLLRSGTSVGANITEAQAAQSPKDFIAKMSIASKEARESNYWLRLLDKSDYLNNYPNKLVIFNMIQSIIKLSSGGGIRLTISKYYLPSGKSISEIGVVPDIKIEENDDNFKINTASDNQLNYAIKLLEG